MIKVKLFKNKLGHIFAFEIKNHGKDIVCAAVSILSLNTVNSIEEFTDTEFKCDFEPDGGYLYFEADNNLSLSKDSILLLKSLALGLKGIEDEYKDKNYISISIEEVG